MADRENRGLAPRAARDQRETMQEDRGDRSRGRGRGALVDYYEDLGFATTKEAYQGWKENEALYSEQKAKAQSQLGAASKELSGEEKKYQGYLSDIDSELNKLGSVTSLVNKAWEDYTGKFNTVNIVGLDGKTLYKKKAPQEAVDNMFKLLPNSWEKSYNKDSKSYVIKPISASVQNSQNQGNQQGQAYGDRGSQYNFSVNGGGFQNVMSTAAVKNKAKQLADAVDSSLDKHKTDFFKTNTQTIAKQREEARNQMISASTNVKNVLNQIAVKKDEIKAANYTIKQIDKMRQEAIDNLREKYEKRAEAIKNYFTSDSFKLTGDEQPPQEG